MTVQSLLLLIQSLIFADRSNPVADSVGVATRRGECSATRAGCDTPNGGQR